MVTFGLPALLPQGQELLVAAVSGLEVALRPGDVGACDLPSVNFLAGAPQVLAGALPLLAAAWLIGLAFFGGFQA